MNIYMSYWKDILRYNVIVFCMPCIHNSIQYKYDVHVRIHNIHDAALDCMLVVGGST